MAETDKVQTTIQNVTGKAKDALKVVKNAVMNGSNIGKIIFILVLIGIIVFFTLYNKKSNKPENTAKQMSQQLSRVPNKITSFNQNDARYTHNLRDYYIMSSHNSCCSGDYQGAFVDKNALLEVIRHGARVLDFEIYSVNGNTVIAASPNQSIYQKGTYNSLPFAETMENVNTWAFSPSTCQNSDDPLFLHFRIKSNQPHVYSDMVKAINTNFKNRKLGKEYNYQYGGHNLGKVPLAQLQGKVIIMCDAGNDMFINTPKVGSLNEYVNIASGSTFMRLLRDSEVKHTPNMDELITYNKKNMSITMSDLNTSDANMNASTHRKYGCQMICMNFQNGDSYMQHYLKYFNDVRHAFVLKPKELRYVVTKLDTPPPQDKRLSFATQTVKKPYYSADF